MKCKDYLEIISRFVDNETSETENVLILDHIRDCSKCRNEYLFLQKEKDLLASVENLEVSPYFNQKLFAKIKDTTKSKFNMVLKFALSTSFVMILFGSLFYFKVFNYNNYSNYTMKDLVNYDFSSANFDQEIMDLYYR